MGDTGKSGIYSVVWQLRHGNFPESQGYTEESGCQVVIRSLEVCQVGVGGGGGRVVEVL